MRRALGMATAGLLLTGVVLVATTGTGSGPDLAGIEPITVQVPELVPAAPARLQDRDGAGVVAPPPVLSDDDEQDEQDGQGGDDRGEDRGDDD